MSALSAIVSPEVLETTLLTLEVCGASTLLSAAIGLPAGTALGLSRRRGSRVARMVVQGLYGVPPVLAGLFVFLLLSRNGPFGGLGLLFTPAGMVLAQTLLVTPLVLGLTAASVAAVPESVVLTIRSLGADGPRFVRGVLHEARRGVASAVLVGFGQAISEVGAVILVGGNIRHHTRVLTTSIVLETEQGRFDVAIALGLVLLGLALVTAGLLTFLSERRPR
ncbi:MAG: ABC transporter permease [Methanobacteriota archaeon]